MNWKTRRNFKRESWMSKYEENLVTARPELAGKIDWDTATYLFNTGESPDAAAQRWLSNHSLANEGERATD